MDANEDEQSDCLNEEAANHPVKFMGNPFVKGSNSINQVEMIKSSV